MKAKKHSHKSYNLQHLVVWALVLVGILDFTLKRLAEFFLAPHEPVFHNPLVDLIFFQNRGIAFSIPLHPLLASIFSFFLLGYFGYIVAQERSVARRISAFAVIIGAISNLYDRVMHGYVTDYLLLGGRSAINVADILILLGIFFFIRYSRSIN